MNVQLRAFHGPSDWGWVRQHLPLHRVEDTGGIVAVDSDKNETIAVCIMDTWTEASVQVHMVITNPMVIRHRFFQEVADYVYNVAGREVMVALVPADNAAALSVDQKIGFVELARIPHGSKRDVDTVVLTMTKDQCRFYEVPDGQAVNSAAA